MMKEKLIFWLLTVIFIGILIFGFVSREKKKDAEDELLQDIKLAVKKGKATKKEERDRCNIENIKAVDTIEGYNLLLKRSPFFKIRTEQKVKKIEPLPIKKEPQKAILKYKGRVIMGSKVMVIIEDEGTGKSFFVKEGDMVGEFLVLHIGEKEVTLKKKGGKEIVLSAVKEEKKEEKKEGK